MRAPPLDDALRQKLLIVIESFRHLTGRALHDEPTPESLWTAPRVIVAHGPEDDPVFFYGNALALDVFAMDFTRFTRLPSRYSAEAPKRDERARLLERVSRDGFIDDYSGIRIGDWEAFSHRTGRGLESDRLDRRLPRAGRELRILDAALMHGLQGSK